ncbi:ABC transporter permease [Dyadobacter fanqingshengii]|uniref:ABC transporter permease n=1 Tax=Dyadobacter fanqingshengii TaxID=2906443 RepID=A0A9X1P7D1_9BACT|nr:ABC transporter permease [Dyadobacter fanqingshengii]MCF0039400.1 ABC transporter permease [Dyadobacter fanqingshengii]USJ33786.1 ABC transporter permease [Dyadobacter fanqingshengii]
MIRNYFKIAWRNLLKRKFYSLVTIFGLSVGMTFTFLIMAYVWGELRVNSELRNADNQYIVRSRWKNPDMGVDMATLGPLGATLKADYPNLVANFYRYDGITVAVSKGEKHFREEVQTGDSTLLAMYGFPLLYGDAKTALSQQNSVAITEEKAFKYFGKTDVLGETLTLHNFIGGKQEFQVNAVLKTVPNNSVTNLLPKPAEVFIPLSSLDGRKGAEDNWDFPYMITYIELQNGVKLTELEKPVNQILATHSSANTRANLDVYFTPLKDYYQEANNGLVRKMIYTLSGVTLFILLMAVVNFVNISIGKSSSRLKEIGVRKVLGSHQTQLIGQFLAESVILALFAMFLSILFYEISRSAFSDILGKPLPSSLALFPYSLVMPLLCAMLIGLMAGIYPAFVLSGISSIDSMKGKLKSIKENVMLRRVLVASQFVIALFVFAGAMIIARQVHYFFNKNLGYSKESLVSIAVPRDWTAEGLSKMEAIRDQFSRLKEVSNVSLSYEIPNGNNGGHAGLYKSGQDSTQAIHTQFLSTDEKYADTYQIRIVAGKFFNANQGAYQPNRIVLNQAAAKGLGYSNPEDAVGQQVRVHNVPGLLTVDGVSADFNFASMHQAIKPLGFFHVKEGNAFRFLTFRLNPGNLGASMSIIENKWRELMPDAPFEYAFMDDTLQKLYQTEMQLKKASQIATLLAVVIVLLGVLGMVSLNVARRTRELGIRKVLGASGLGIIMLFLKEFLLVMALAMLIAFPLAFLTMQRWLETYAFRIQIGWEPFAMVGLGFCLIVILLVCLQTTKASLMNPVKSLRSE